MPQPGRTERALTTTVPKINGVQAAAFADDDERPYGDVFAVRLSPWRHCPRRGDSPRPELHGTCLLDRADTGRGWLWDVMDQVQSPSGFVEDSVDTPRCAPCRIPSRDREERSPRSAGQPATYSGKRDSCHTSTRGFRASDAEQFSSRTCSRGINLSLTEDQTHPTAS